MIQAEGIFAGENLDAVLAEQAELIADIKTALESKAAASVETCTLTISYLTPNATDPTSLTCVLADGTILDGHTRNVATDGVVYILPKPCCILLNGFDSISGAYTSRYNMSVFIISGDVTVSGRYSASATEPA